MARYVGIVLFVRISIVEATKNNNTPSRAQFAIASRTVMPKKIHALRVFT